jgi:hypothetical protein
MKRNVQCESLRVLAEVCELAPEVRLGQLFAHLGLLGETHFGCELAYLDDDELLSVHYRHRDELRARLSAPAAPTVKPVNDPPPLADPVFGREAPSAAGF